MASEPNNANAEEQLKQYAAERRQRVPEVLHQATRNLLQGEVRRVYGATDQERRSRFRLRWFQALAWLLILAAIPLFLMPRIPGSKMKLEQAVPSRENEVTLPSATTPGEAPIVMSDTKEPVHPPALEPSRARAGGGAAAAKDTAGASLPTAPVTTMTARDEVKSVPVARSLSLQRGQAIPEPSKKPETLAAPAVATAAANNVTLNFANTVPNQQVLSNFKLEQTGARLKILENDGSVYSGRVLTQQAGNDAFQAAGINRTLNKATIITGQVVRANLASVGLQQQSATSNVQNVRNYPNLGNSASNNTLNNNTSEEVRVQGAAIIGNTQYKVDAQSTPGP